MVGARFVVCADDYGMSGGVSRGIVELGEAGRISATGAMTCSPDWSRTAPLLAPLAGRIGIGLHLTLTGLGPLGAMTAFAPSGRFPALGAVLRGALRRRLPLGEIAVEIGRQLDAFENAVGRPPDFVDGHQHVHALPGIRDVLLGELARRAGARPWLRDPADRLGSIVGRRRSVGKAFVVAGLSAGFGAAARRAGFNTNQGFAGFSDFGAEADLGADFARFLDRPGPAPLIMCHPGRVVPGEALDEVVDARERERAFLMSDAWPALLRHKGVTLVPAPGA